MGGSGYIKGESEGLWACLGFGKGVSVLRIGGGMLRIGLLGAEGLVCTG